MYCSKCGGLVQDGAGQCLQCGAMLTDELSQQGAQAYQAGPPAAPPGAPAGAQSPGSYPYPPPQPQGKTGTTVGLIVGCLMAGIIGIFFIGILAAIAIPDFLKFQARAKQAEAKTNLGEIFTAQVYYYGEYNTFATSFEELGWMPQGNNMYSYYLPNEVISSSLGNAPALPAGTSPQVDYISFTVVAVGNVDRDGFLDVWTINDAKILMNVNNDVGN